MAQAQLPALGAELAQDEGSETTAEQDAHLLESDSQESKEPDVDVMDTSEPLDENQPEKVDSEGVTGDAKLGETGPVVLVSSDDGKDFIEVPDKPAGKPKKKKKKKARTPSPSASESSRSSVDGRSQEGAKASLTEETMMDTLSSNPQLSPKVLQKEEPTPVSQAEPKTVDLRVPKVDPKPAPKVDTPTPSGSGARPKVPTKDKPKVPVKEAPKAPKAVVEVTPPPPKGSGKPDTTADTEPVEEVEPGWSRAESKKDRKKRAKKAHKLDAASCDKKVNCKLVDYVDKYGKTRLPPRMDKKTGESDDEDWLEDDCHPIDWYVKELESVLASATILKNVEVRTKLQYAWSYYVPGDPCPFIRCQVRTGDRRVVKCSTRARFARHVLETHMTARLMIYCVAGEPGTRDACNRWDDGEFHRCVRRGDHVRHLMRNGMHQLPARRARELVNNCWASTVGTNCVGKLQKRLVRNTVSRQFKLADDEWSRCLGKDVKWTVQRELGAEESECSPTEPETKRLKRQRALQKDPDPVGDSAVGSNAKRRKANAPVEKGKVPQVPKEGATLPKLSRIKTRQLGQWSKLCRDQLGAAAAEKLTAAFVERHQEAPPPAASAPTPATLSTSGTDWSSVVKGPAKTVPEGPEEEPEADEGSNILVSVPLPLPCPEFSAIATPASLALRDAMSLEYSRVMSNQVMAWEQAVISASGMIGLHIQNQGREELSDAHASLEAERQVMTDEARYFQDRYTEISARLERTSAALYTQFGVSVDSWERAGYPLLTPRMPVVSRRPTGSVTGLGLRQASTPRGAGMDSPTSDMLTSSMSGLGGFSASRPSTRAFGSGLYQPGSFTGGLFASSSFGSRASASASAPPPGEIGIVTDMLAPRSPAKSDSDETDIL